MFPFKSVTKLSDTDRELFKTFLSRENKKVISIDETKIILDIYANSFNRRIEPCNTCASIYNSIINDLTKLYDYGA